MGNLYIISIERITHQGVNVNKIRSSFLMSNILDYRLYFKPSEPKGPAVNQEPRIMN